MSEADGDVRPGGGRRHLPARQQRRRGGGRQGADDVAGEESRRRCSRTCARGRHGPEFAHEKDGHGHDGWKVVKAQERCERGRRLLLELGQEPFRGRGGY